MKTSDHTRARSGRFLRSSLIRCWLFVFFRKIFPGPRHVDEKLSIHAIVKSRFSIFRGTRCGPQRLDTRIRMFAVVHLLLRLIYRKRRALNEIMNRIASETQNKDRFGFLWFFLCRIVKQRLMGSLKQPLMTTALCRHNDRPLPSIVFQLVTLKTATDSDRIGKLLFDVIDALAVLTATGRSKTFCASKDQRIVSQPNLKPRRLSAGVTSYEPLTQQLYEPDTAALSLVCLR